MLGHFENVNARNSNSFTFCLLAPASCLLSPAISAIAFLKFKHLRLKQKNHSAVANLVGRHKLQQLEIVVHR
ncbi:hypothetical protein NIES25_50920 [Nostoc linckia NIES-25]|nr:hypothetical protein NIES25_50920 [Nostoc linckia NIES-25]